MPPCATPILNVLTDYGMGWYIMRHPTVPHDLPNTQCPSHCTSRTSPITSFPGLLHLQFLIACSMLTTEGEALGILARYLWH